MGAQQFVGGLAIRSGAGCHHQQMLGCGKGTIDGQVALDGGTIDAQAGHQLVTFDQHLIHRQENLRQHNAPVSRIVECALKQ